MRPVYHLRGFWRWQRLRLKHGKPARVFWFNGGAGDQLLCSTLAHELARRGGGPVWLLSRHPELFVGNSDVAAVAPPDLALFPWLRLGGTPVEQVYYTETLIYEDRDVPPAGHILGALCRRAGVRGRVVLRPYLPAIAPAPRPRRSRPRVAIHSSCMNARYPMANKQWPVDRWQAVAAALADEVELVQIGSPEDPLLTVAKDCRGGASLLDAARILAGCDLFVGMVGFLMHLARAVECPSVIVYGGREPPEITGYICNRHLTSRPPCAPCWQYNKCDFLRRCLTAITVPEVLAAIRDSLRRPAVHPLAAAEVNLTDG